MYNLKKNKKKIENVNMICFVFNKHIVLKTNKKTYKKLR